MFSDTDLDSFRQRFTQGLARMLDDDALGAFILVLANSMQDEPLHAALMPALRTRFTTLMAAFDAGRLQGAPDDVAVFEALAKRGIEAFGTWEMRCAGPWQLAFNPLRALRPPRGAGDKFTSIRQPFDPDRFHFDKPFLRPEIMAEVDFDGTPLRIMYHKFPFAPYHLMLLPKASAHLPQVIDDATHRLLWRISEAAGRTLPGFGLACNTLGGGASINHLHAHAFVDTTPLPIERPQWAHNGGASDYPLHCRRLSSVEESADAIDELNHRNQPFNLFYRPGHCYLLPRRPQGDDRVPSWLRSAAWFEVCGGFNLFDRDRFDSLDATEIEQGLRTLRV